MKFMLLEAEKRRRDSIQDTEQTNPKKHHTGHEAANPSDNKDSWADKALGKIAISAIATVVAFYLLWLFRAHLGLP